MKKILFLNSHMYSGSPELYDSLSENSYIQGYRANRQRTYLNNYDFFQILNLDHKRNDKHAIYLDEIYNNYALSTRMDLSKCYFIHLIRPPNCLNLAYDRINSNFLLRKYLYRLRRICEIAKRAPKSIFLTFEDLKNENSMELIKDFLSLKDKPNLPDLKNIEVKKEVIPYSLMKEVEIGYEKYYAFLRKNVPQTNLT